MPNLWFDQAYYISQKVAQMNATKYRGQTGSADTVWDEASATAELESFGVTWEDNFRACNRDGYASRITVQDINVSPTPLFNVGEYAQAVANYYNANQEDGRTDWTASNVISYLLTTDHTSLWDHYTNVGAKLGLNPSNSFSTNLWADAQAASTGSTAAAVLAGLAPGVNPVMAFLDGGGTVESAADFAVTDPVVVPADFNAWASSGGDTPGPDEPSDVTYTQTLYLTEGRDDYTGAANQNTLFIAQEFDGVNTLQSGDVIKGGGGQNMLLADVTAGNTFGQTLNAVRPTVEGVQKIKFSSEQSTNDHNGDPVAAEIRADRISGANEIWSSDSRATLVVNDVRIASNKMDVGWQNADNAQNAADDMDYVLRYNNQWLKSDGRQDGSSLVLNVIDARGAAETNNEQPLRDNPYDAVQFTLNGQVTRLDFGTVDANANYDTLLNAIRDEIVRKGLQDKIEANLGDEFTYYTKTAERIPVHGYSIVITAIGNNTVTDADARWIPTQGVPGDSDLDTDITPDTNPDCPLIKTNIDLDNVGMVNWNNNLSTCIPNDEQFGDYAGDMIVGGMGNGHYVGVQRFDVTVDRGSWLSSLQSTNDSLRMITVKNTDLDDDGTEIGTTPTDKGNLFIGDGQRLSDNRVAGDSLMFEGRDGLLANAELLAKNYWGQTEPQHVGQTVASGIVDVGRFDAVDMQGKANVAVTVTSHSSDKYLKDSDQVNDLGDRFAPQPMFSYQFGSGDDTVNMNVNGNVAADSDFKMFLNMGDGNNSVHFAFDNTWTLEDGKALQNWVHDQWQNNNVTITTGSGNDIVNPWGTGRVNVSTGSGVDVVYSDNSGIANALKQDDAAENALIRTAREGVEPTPAEAILSGTGAIWTLNAQTDKNMLVINDGNFDVSPYGNDFASNPNWNFIANNLPVSDGSVIVTATVTYKGISSTTSMAPITLVANGNTGYATFTAKQVNQLIMDTVNNTYIDGGNSWLGSILSAQEGAGNTLLLISKVDGQHEDDAQDVSISLRVTQSVTGAAVSNVGLQGFAGGDSPYAFNAGSCTTEMAEANVLPVKMPGHWDAATGGWVAEETLPGSESPILVTGNDSAAQADNRIDLGADTDHDLAVLSTSDYSNQTIVVSPNHWNDTVLNFNLNGETGQDFFDATSILGGWAQKVLNTPGQISSSANLGSIEVQLDSGKLVNGSMVNGRDIVFLQNAAKDDPGFISSASSLQTLLNDNSVNSATDNNTLFMVYNGSKADFDMYLAQFNASGTASVSEVGSISFRDFIVGKETKTDAVSDFLSGATEFGKANIWAYAEGKYTWEQSDKLDSFGTLGTAPEENAEDVGA